MRTLRTLEDIVNHIHNPSAEVATELLPHLNSLKGPRTRGSTTDKSLLELLDTYGDKVLQPIEESDKPLIGSGCSAFFINLSYDEQSWMNSVLNCASLLNYDEGEEIIARKGPHGWELVLKEPCDVNIPAYRIYFIWSDDSHCLATWHPGKPIRNLPYDCAVKLR
jgi:hypothetical protein